MRVVAGSVMVGRFAGQTTVGFGNYQRLIADPHFARAAWNNLAYAVGTIGPSLILALGLALALRETTRLTGILRTLVVMPLLIPLVAAAALFSFILLPGDGLLDFYLHRLGLGMVNWLGDPDLALGSVTAITVWKNTGYYMLFFLAGLAGVPQDLLDAAKIDGAGALRRLRNITLPGGPRWARRSPFRLPRHSRAPPKPPHRPRSSCSSRCRSRACSPTR